MEGCFGTIPRDKKGKKDNNKMIPTKPIPQLPKNLKIRKTPPVKGNSFLDWAIIVVFIIVLIIFMIVEIIK